MTTTMTITLLIITAASIALNVFQYMERRIERKNTDVYIAENAGLNTKYQSLLKTYNNEKLHKEWAIGRIKDQQACIDQLRQGKIKRTYKTRKEGEK